MKAVDLKAVTFKYKGQASPVFEDVFFELDQGQIAAIIGPSGCGKSTLGYCICGVIPEFIEGEFKGEVKLQGRPGIVFQDPDNQIFLPTVEDELAFGPENLCLSHEEIGKRINETLELIGLSHLRMRNPIELSGGQKQLVALAGVLTLAPDIIVLDEALAQLDSNIKKKIKNILISLKKQGKTLILIEHEKRNLDIADEIWLLDEGKLVQQSTPREDREDA